MGNAPGPAHPGQMERQVRILTRSFAINVCYCSPQVKTDDPNLILSTGVANYIYDFERDTTGKGVISPDADWYLPIWQVRKIQLHEPRFDCNFA